MGNTKSKLAQAAEPGKGELERHPFGPRSLAAIVPAIIRPACRRRSPAAAQLIADWPAIVGPELACQVAPLRLERGTLTLACTGPLALELQHLAPEMGERINAALGSRVVERLRFVQQTLPPVPKRKRPPAPARPDPEPKLAGIAEGPLRAALAALGRAVMAGS